MVSCRGLSVWCASVEEAFERASNNYTYTSKESPIYIGIIGNYSLNAKATLQGHNNPYVEITVFGSVSRNGAYSFNIESGATLSFNDGTFEGNGQDDCVINNEGTFLMSGNSVITNAANSGVHIASGATFTMNGGEISNNNTSSNGAGVYVEDNATFSANGGVIRENQAAGVGDGVYQNGNVNISSNANISDTIFMENDKKLTLTDSFEDTQNSYKLDVDTTRVDDSVITEKATGEISKTEKSKFELLTIGHFIKLKVSVNPTTH